MQHGFDVTPSAPRNRAQGPITVQDVSQDNFSHAMPEVTASGGVMVMFFWAKVRITTKDAAKDGTFETRLCVAKQPKDDRATVATSYISKEDAERLFPAEYHAFTANEELPTTGTPLSELPGITMSQIGYLTLAGLRSIEDLADLSSEQANEIGFEAIRAHKLAKQWIEKSEGNADSLNAIAALSRAEGQLAASNEQNKKLEQQMAMLQAQIDALKSIGQTQSVAQAEQSAAQPAPAPALDTEKLPDIDDTPNPLAEGEGVAEVEMPDPLADD